MPVLLLVSAILLPTTVAGCGAADPPVTGGPGGAASAAYQGNAAGAVPEPEAATATAQTAYGLVAGGDYAGAWELWSDAGKRALDRAEFVRLHSACVTRPGVPPTIVATRPVDRSTVEIDWRLGTRTGTDRLLFADGAWRLDPGPESLALYRRRGTGDCAVT